MQVRDKVIVVTGGGSGIGRAMVARFVADGARQVVAADINAANAEATVAAHGGVAMAVDVTKEADVARLIEETEAQHGPIDLFCSNAGIGTGASEQAPLDEWQLSWDVNVMAHVFAARHLVPRMIARGGGYLLNTASAAGLLNQIGGAAYGVTKHAAVGFGEWLAMTYGHQGIKISMLCPQAVRTPMTTGGDAMDRGGVQAASVDGMMEPEVLVESLMAGLEEERFMILPHAEVATYFQRKADDYDRWIGGMNRLHQRLMGA